ncbi:TolC family protein [Litorimonas cladophorae]|nr:TolC family protein [Litorimonas cladophorae]
MMKPLRRLLVTAAFGTLSACASLSPPQTNMAEMAADIPATWLLDLPSDTTGPQGWANLYDDPILLRYLDMAAAQNFDVKSAQTRVIAAEAELRRAAARLKPQLDASASASGGAILSDIDNAFDSYGLGLSGRWDPDVFGETKTIIESSRANLRAQEALAADTRQAILASTGRAYVSAVEATLQVDLAKTNLEFLTESRRISEARYRLGDTAKGDFSFAEANYQSALASYESTLQSARAARRALSILLGDYPTEDLELATELNTPNALPARDLPAAILERRPDIIAARAQLAGRVASLQGAKLAKWPSLGLSGSLSSGSAFKDLFDPGDYIARLGASLSQVLFDGGAIEAGIDSAQANLDVSLLSYEQRLRLAMAEITDAYDRAETLKRTLVNLELSSDAANEALRLESIQFDLGESSLLDVLQVQTRVNSIDASLIRTKAALLQTVITANEAIAGFI